ncbi:hypothetical protein EXIGLDRAFT_732076 [Exidia glandulosa HHB12029]|uniref:Uncharacterized protein n=1 Tax=Exidia glandulosa HHB12029 TaxID=1314781 RepID=A0A165BNL8_EXIGL|nr:hypothetical protein EXIGLDRAFT_732076 [Exidia glandulosa HHB12029]
MRLLSLSLLATATLLSFVSAAPRPADYSFISPPAKAWLLEHGWDGKSRIPADGFSGGNATAVVVRRASSKCKPPKPGVRPGLFITSELNWGGASAYIPDILGRQKAHKGCIPITGPLSGKIASFGPDKGIKCTGFSDDSCNAELGADAPKLSGLTYPGISTLDGWESKDEDDCEPSWKDDILSIQCEAA